MTSVKIPSTPTRADSRRPSADPTTNQSPTSPFFHNLTSRLRKSSNASSLSAADQSPAPRDPVTRTESTRAARRALQALIRNDWEYPPPSGTTTANTNRTVRTPIGYRLREESLSDLENEELFARRRTKTDPYKFESPESIGNQLAEKRLKRKRAQEEELEWNKGLRTWSQRRDAWTCAVLQRPQDQHQHQYQQSQGSNPLQPTRSRSSPYKSRLSKSHSHERKTSASTSTSNSNTDGSGSISAASTASAGAIQTKPTILSTSPTTQNIESSSIDTISSSPTTTTTSTTLTPSRDSSSSSSSSSLTVPYIPVFPPLLADSDNGPNSSDAFALRSRIKSSAYPTIYSKIVVQSLTPNVPIPLNHMISALVDGWKAEGNWPPQSQAQPLGLAGIDGAKKKNRKSAAFLRWRKEHPAATTFPKPGSASVPLAIGSVPTPLLFGGNGDILRGGGGGGGDAAAVALGAPDCGGDDSKSRVRRSMSSLKRVLSGGSGDGLQELGIEFREQGEEEMEKNVTLKR